MGKGSKSGASHQLFKDRAKNRVDDLQGVFSDLQSARKESRSVDVAMLEEQVNQMLREWKSELSESSPASSLQQGGSLDFSSDICRLLQLCEEEDDATSVLAAPKPDPDAQKAVDQYTSQENFNVPKGPEEPGFQLEEQCKNAAVGVNMGMNNMNVPSQLEYHSFDFHQDFEQQYIIGFDGTGFTGEGVMPQIPGYQPNISPPPSAFLGPKCALWDCTRPALGLEWCQKSDDYCSIYHAGLAPSEGYPGSPPVVRPRGIGLKDNLLFAALGSKAQGKDVGIPECEGAATAKSPWNAPELFDLTVLDGETIREWLFFDKPRRAFESGNRKQRSLPDYNGRGWHESRKQVMNEFGGLKRSYYMDPQPMENFEWHLYEYEINKYNVFALYRLEVKRADAKKSPKGKLGNDSLADLQKQMGRLSAEVPNEKQRVVKGRGKGNAKEGSGRIHSGSNALAATPGVGIDYLVEDINGYYIHDDGSGKRE
ncbi:transcription factor VOZ1-like isoform X2 [Salvia splendens]|nr:transcription factor VOZ1-like isoform X2 [Salvia splendens]XP_042028965.1 transcription factor VOZ1-like isoform X2 [Salvia splendens]XP_042028966.1 transcription factor VOZ1-like isoform X2 [Salvia splendens]XP_042028967.1 transcription factor VOZ1-like isoform X2 [Salvia splendens]